MLDEKLNNLIEEWHNGVEGDPTYAMPLYEFLDITLQEYKNWVFDNDYKYLEDGE